MPVIFYAINQLTLYVKGFPVVLPTPMSPAHNARKFSAVFGAISLYNSKTKRPEGISPIDMSINTLSWGGLSSPSTVIFNRDSQIINETETNYNLKTKPAQKLQLFNSIQYKFTPPPLTAELNDMCSTVLYSVTG
jgi:hypothetical protein